MKKDHDLCQAADWCKHTRNSPFGKTGVNRVKRHKVKQAIKTPLKDEAKPLIKKQKRWGIKRGKRWCNWYKTEKARDQAFENLLKTEMANSVLFSRICDKGLRKMLVDTGNIEKIEK